MKEWNVKDFNSFCADCGYFFGENELRCLKCGACSPEEHCHEIRKEIRHGQELQFEVCVPFHEEHCFDCHDNSDCRCLEHEG